MASFSWDVTIKSNITSAASGRTTVTKDWTGSVYQNRLGTITDAVVEYRLVNQADGTYYADSVSGDGTYNLFFNNVKPGTYRMQILNRGGGEIESRGSVTF